MQLCRNIGHFLVCVRPFALHRQQTENDKQNVDFAPPTKSSAGAYGYRPRANQSGTDWQSHLQIITAIKMHKIYQHN